MTGRRRTLVEGLKARPPADRRKEESFIYGTPEQPKNQPRASQQKAKAAEPAVPPPSTGSLPGLGGRVPLTTRIRPDLATALKRASLERQLAGETPNTVQDILEQALEPWLTAHGYLKD